MNNIEFRLYYDDEGKVITYTTEKLLGNNYIVILKEQYAEARSDVLVKDNKLWYTHLKKHVEKMIKSKTGKKTSKYDINILIDDTDNSEFTYWKNTINDIK